MSCLEPRNSIRRCGFTTRRQASLFLILAFCLMIFSRNAWSQPPAAPPNATVKVFDGDLRLNRTVSVNVAGITLQELCKSLSSKSVKLRAFDNCANLKVQVCVKNRSVKSIMRALSEVFGSEWYLSPEKDSYAIGPLSKTTIKRDRWWQLFLAEREKAMQINRQNEAEVLQKGIVIGKTHQLEPAQIDQIKQNAEFYQRLPADIQERILARNNFDFFYSLEASFTSFDDEGATPALLGDLTPWHKDYIKRMLSRSPTISSKAEQAGLEKVGLMFLNVGSLMTCSVIVPGERSSFDSVILHAGNENYQAQLLSPIHESLPGMLKIFPKYSTPSLKRLSEFMLERVWKNDLTAVNQERFLRKPRSQVLDWMARQGNLEFVSDYHSTYSVPMTPEELKAPLKQSLEKELNWMASLQDVSWKKNVDGITLVRNNRWYRDDYLEVPAELIRRLLKEELIVDPKTNSLEADISNPAQHSILVSTLRKRMDRIAEIVQKLSPWQVAFGLKYALPSRQDAISDSVKSVVANELPNPLYGVGRRLMGSGFPFYSDSSYALNHYRTNLFYSSLASESRDLLLQSKLPWEKLSTQQREAVDYLIPSLELMRRQGEDVSRIQLSLGFNLKDTRMITGKLNVVENPTEK